VIDAKTVTGFKIKLDKYLPDMGIYYTTRLGLLYIPITLKCKCK
jgi:hypothetical protein